jgi:hypothetical protein
VFKFSAAVVLAFAAAGAFASEAEARAGGSFYASPFFRNQGRQPATPGLLFDLGGESKRKASEAAAARARARRLEAEQAAAAERRARAIEYQRQQAQKAAAEKSAREAAAAKAAEKNTASTQPQSPPATDVAAKREDRLPNEAAVTKAADDVPVTKAAATTTAAATATAAATTTASTSSNEQVSTSRAMLRTNDDVKEDAPRVCRRYSAAANGLVEVPCD